MAVNTANTYWSRAGKHEALALLLRDKVPAMGEIKGSKNKALERFRNASNCYYDLYNNGLCNRARAFARVFGIPSGQYGSYGHGFVQSLYNQVEEKMDAIILAAAKEQGLQ